MFVKNTLADEKSRCFDRFAVVESGQRSKGAEKGRLSDRDGLHGISWEIHLRLDISDISFTHPLRTIKARVILVWPRSDVSRSFRQRREPNRVPGQTPREPLQGMLQTLSESNLNFRHCGFVKLLKKALEKPYHSESANCL